MKIKRFWNTKKRGVMEFLIYKEGNKYVGVCLTFDIIEEGKDVRKLKKSLIELADLHLKAVVKKGLPDELLNRYAPDEYWDKYFKIENSFAKKRLELEFNKIKDSTTLNFTYPTKDLCPMA